MAKKGRKGAKKQLTKEELAKIKELLDQEMREAFEHDPQYFGQEYAINGGGTLGTEHPMKEDKPSEPDDNEDRSEGPEFKKNSTPRMEDYATAQTERPFKAEDGKRKVNDYDEDEEI